MLDMINVLRVLPRYNTCLHDTCIFKPAALHEGHRHRYMYCVSARSTLHRHDEERQFTWHAFRRSNFFIGLISFQVGSTCMTTVALNLFASQGQKQCYLISDDSHYKVRLH